MQPIRIFPGEENWIEYLDDPGARAVRETVSERALRQFVQSVRDFERGCGVFSPHEIVLEDRQLKMRLAVRAEALLKYLDSLKWAG